MFVNSVKRKKISLGSENFLLRGSSLQNTQYVIGLIVYAGHQTKIMMNSSNTRFKMSRLEKTTNKQILIVFVVQVICCLIGAILSVSWQTYLKDHSAWYLGLQTSGSSNQVLLVLQQTGTWILIFTYDYSC
jgi:magnesium-transporting ATPase (P-type)